MSRGDSARTHYESAREELILRIQLRDRVLLLYLGGVATISGVAIGSKGVQTQLLLILPFLTLGIAMIATQHNALIGAIGYFCVNEIEPYLKDLPNSEYAPQWDSSTALEEYSQRAVRFRSWGHTAIMLLPSFASLVVTYQEGINPPTWSTVLWWFGIFCVGSIIILIYKTYSWRKHLYERTFNTGAE
jgi:hypothetical protein